MLTPSTHETPITQEGCHAMPTEPTCAPWCGLGPFAGPAEHATACPLHHPATLNNGALILYSDRQPASSDERKRCVAEMERRGLVSPRGFLTREALDAMRIEAERS